MEPLFVEARLVETGSHLIPRVHRLASPLGLKNGRELELVPSQPDNSQTSFALLLPGKCLASNCLLLGPDLEKLKFLLSNLVGDFLRNNIKLHLGSIPYNGKRGERSAFICNLRPNFIIQERLVACNVYHIAPVNKVTTCRSVRISQVSR